MDTQSSPCSYEEHAAFLKETAHLDFNHPMFSQALNEVVTDDMSLAQKLEELFYFTRDVIPFASDASLTASEALRKRKALCYTKAMIYVSFCRRLGVPARLVGMKFKILADLPDAREHYHGAAKLFYNGWWRSIDTVSNRDAWFGWWLKDRDAGFEPPAFTLERDTVVDSAYVAGLTFEDYATNDVPQAWLDHMRKFIDTGHW
jgi:transglutaminase-like putative cysteine protease